MLAVALVVQPVAAGQAGGTELAPGVVFVAGAGGDAGGGVCTKRQAAMADEATRIHLEALALVGVDHFEQVACVWHWKELKNQFRSFGRYSGRCTSLSQRSCARRRFGAVRIGLAPRENRRQVACLRP